MGENVRELPRPLFADSDACGHYKGILAGEEEAKCVFTF